MWITNNQNIKRLSHHRHKLLDNNGTILADILLALQGKQKLLTYILGHKYMHKSSILWGSHHISHAWAQFVTLALIIRYEGVNK